MPQNLILCACAQYGILALDYLEISKIQKWSF